MMTLISCVSPITEKGVSIYANKLLYYATNIIDFENRRDRVLKAVTALVGTQELSEQCFGSVFKVTVHAAPVYIGSSDVAGLK